tara:strand:+ start:5876 stop:6256 length:381 start_codon:yes stop_codon:yes gene_type:complete
MQKKNNYTNKFDIDLAKGMQMEETLKEFFEGKRIEVKSERHIWETTGNHFVEYECRGKPSGIAVTEAEFWALMLIREDETIVMVYIVPIERMKALARKHWNNKTIGGDDNASKGVLVPIEEIGECI